MLESYAVRPSVVCHFARHPTLSYVARLVAIELQHNQVENKGQVLTSKKELAITMNINIRQIGKALKELAMAGFYNAAPKKDVTGSFEIEPHTHPPHDTRQLDIEDAIATKQGEQQSKPVLKIVSTIPIHLCDGKYTLIGPETKLSKASLEVLEKALRSEEPINVSSPFRLPRSVEDYADKQCALFTKAGFLQDNLVRMTYWRLKDVKPAAEIQHFLDKHMKEVHAALEGLA